VARRLALAVALVAALLPVAGAGGADAQAPRRGGTLVMGTLREPPCLNAFMERCHQGIPPAGHIMNLVLRGAFAVGPGFTWRPDLVTSVDVTTRPPYTLTYRIRPKARWSDDVPITAWDFEFTHQALLTLSEGDREPLSLDEVKRIRVVNAKTLRVVLRSRFASWRGLFPNVLPRHALRGQDFSTVWLKGIHDPRTGRPIGSGPFVITDWDQGRSLSFARNARYWGTHPAYLDGIELRFCGVCGTLQAEQLEWLRNGELDLVAAIGPSAVDVAEFRRLRGVRVLSTPGPNWEHFDIRTKRGAHPALERKLVRRAIAYGIDRAAIARIYGASGRAFEASQSAVFRSGSPEYRANWVRYRHRPREARRLLEQAGCLTGDDGIYRCDGVRLSLRFFTTAGAGGARERTLEFVRRQLAQVGIEVVPTYVPSLVLFQQILPSGDFDVALYNWISTTPDTALDSINLYGCHRPKNYLAYCQRLVTGDLDQATRILDRARLRVVLNRADAQLANDVPVIPLVDRPVLAAFYPAVEGVSLDTHAWNPFQNAENWWLDD
jgi:peptide/nickel transport system substrate-binding protein